MVIDHGLGTRVPGRTEANGNVSYSPRSLEGGSFCIVLLGMFLLTPGCARQEHLEKSNPEKAPRSVEQVAGDLAHEKVFAIAEEYPSAATCRDCHSQHYREWSVSQHAYSQVSPVFNSMHGTLLKRTNGTLGDFCTRCHNPVGMQTGEPLLVSNLERAPVSVEGITCIVCHRTNANYGKHSGRLFLRAGGLTDPVLGPVGNEELATRLSDPDFPPMSVREGVKGTLPIHGRIEPFFALSTSGFCGTCHDVTLLNGFRLEEAFSEFKHSPAAARGESCQDCHMGVTPGTAEGGYATGPAAVVKGRKTTPRRLTNHLFAGPDYPVVHPALFPHNPDRNRVRGVTIADWLRFDHLAGWGESSWEKGPGRSFEFPAPWEKRSLRRKARRFIDKQVDLLRWADGQRREILRRGYVLEAVELEQADRKGITFRARVANGTDGHNVPTGFSAERLVFLRVTVVDQEGTVVFRSGDLDPNGDLRDLHSIHVHHGKIPLDRQLFSLQSKFITRNIRGGDREQILAVNYSVDPLPFLRPATRSNILTGRPGGARIHKVGIEPGGHRWARYRIDGKLLTGKGPYTATLELVAGMIPVNLIHEIQGVGFDYGMTARGIADAVVQGLGPPDEEGHRIGGHQILWSQRLEIPVEEGPR